VIDADIVMKVTSSPAGGADCGDAIAYAFGWLLEETTLRPIYGVVNLCSVSPDDFEKDLFTVVHEVLHALVRSYASHAL
jgi:hypothetical protein